VITFINEDDMTKRKLGVLIRIEREKCIPEALSGRETRAHIDHLVRVEILEGLRITLSLWYDGRQRSQFS